MYRTEVATAINDCMYRTAVTSDYVAFVDLDEFIYPLVHNSLVDIINLLSARLPATTAAFVVKSSNVHFNCRCLKSVFKIF